MIDLNLLRENPDVVRASQHKRGERIELVDEALQADTAHRRYLRELEELRAQQNQITRQVKTAANDQRPNLIQAAKALGEQITTVTAQVRTTEADLHMLRMRIPNLVLDAVPTGGEDDYVVLHTHGTIPTQDFEVKDHLTLATDLDILDMARGAKVSGTRFYFLKGAGYLLQAALMRMGMDLAIEHGFTPMQTPTLVKPEIMAGTGFLGAHADEIYHLDEDDLYLTGTSEVALAGYHADEIIDLTQGAKRYVGTSTCYRREAGAAGKDTRGIIRVHQFEKLEMFTYINPADAETEHERLLAMQETMLHRLELPYRVIDTAAGDLGTSAARKYDIEAWIPTQERYRELTSTSNCTTFQARRLNTRHRGADGKTEPVATLNGTLATTRWLVALLEIHQTADGNMRIPVDLQPYLGRDMLR